MYSNPMVLVAAQRRQRAADLILRKMVAQCSLLTLLQSITNEARVPHVTRCSNVIPWIDRLRCIMNSSKIEHLGCIVRQRLGVSRRMAVEIVEPICFVVDAVAVAHDEANVS